MTKGGFHWLIRTFDAYLCNVVLDEAVRRLGSRPSRLVTRLKRKQPRRAQFRFRIVEAVRANEWCFAVKLGGIHELKRRDEMCYYNDARCRFHRSK